MRIATRLVQLSAAAAAAAAVAVAEPATTIRVGRSPSAHAATIAGGVALVPLGRWAQRWTVAVEPGVYRERVWVNASMGPLTLVGLGAPEDTLLVYHCCYRGDGTPRCSNASADRSCAPQHPGPGTGPNRVISRTGTLLIEAADFMVLNLTVANDACGYDSRHAWQSQAVQALADRTAFRHTRLLGGQDTLFAGNVPGDRQYFLESYINGSCDSIYGTSSIVFDRCEIAITDSVTATRGARFTPPSDDDKRAGRAVYLFYNSSLVKPVEGQKAFPAKDGGTMLGRPWSWVIEPDGSSHQGGHSLAAVVYRGTFMDSHINKAGWSDWGNGCSKGAGGGSDCTPRMDATGLVHAGDPSCWCENVSYAEQGSYGPGASPDTRVKWSRQIQTSGGDGLLVALGLTGTTPRAVMGNWVPPFAEPRPPESSWRVCTGWSHTLGQVLHGNDTGSLALPLNVTTAEAIGRCSKACCVASSCFAWVTGPGEGRNAGKPWCWLKSEAAVHSERWALNNSLAAFGIAPSQ
jgi:pectinesterase